MAVDISDSGNNISSKDVLIALSPAVVAVCEDFAAKRMDGSKTLYQQRGESSVDKIKQDIKTGALAEFAVYEYLTSKGIESSKPDLTIYENNKKSFGPDIIANGHKIHIKSQTSDSAAKYGSSWLFQKSDKLFQTPPENELMVFCIVKGSSVTIKAIVKVIDIVEAEIASKPKVWKYQDTKLALYLEDVLKSDIELWRL